MEEYFFLVVTFGGMFSDYASALPFSSLEACWDAAEVLEKMMEQPVDMFQCVPTFLPTVKPLPNPFY
jgi:hypothetical protein